MEVLASFSGLETTAMPLASLDVAEAVSTLTVLEGRHDDGDPRRTRHRRRPPHRRQRYRLQQFAAQRAPPGRPGAGPAARWFIPSALLTDAPPNLYNRLVPSGSGSSSGFQQIIRSFWR